jgi:hypothetical protein
MVYLVAPDVFRSQPMAITIIPTVEGNQPWKAQGWHTLPPVIHADQGVATLSHELPSKEPAYHWQLAL